MASLRYLWVDPALRLVSLLIFLVGAITSTFAPHVSVLAVQRFGLGDAGLAVLMVISMLVLVVASIGIGIRTDQTADRRQLAVLAAALWVVGQAIMTVWPSPASFVLTQALLFPLATTLFGQIFALARLAASTYPQDIRDSILSAVRAVFAAPFVVVLPVWAAIFQAGVDVMVIYPAALVMALAVLLLILRFWPAPGQGAWDDKPSGISFRVALAELASGQVTRRILALGAVMGASATYITVIGLLMVTTPGRGAADATLYIGLVAGLEVPFMLMLVPALRGFSRPALILGGASIYALHLLLMPLLAESPWLWALILPAAVGGALTLTVPIAYLQDMMGSRPGAGSALITLQQLVAQIMAAGCFAVGTAVWGYTLVLFLGAAASLVGAGALYLADTRRGRA